MKKRKKKVKINYRKIDPDWDFLTKKQKKLIRELYEEYIFSSIHK